MHGALGNDLPPLPGHEVEQLVHEEGRRQGVDAPARDGDELPADGAAELAGVARERGHDALQTLQAHRVRARKQLGRVLRAVERTCNQIWSQDCGWKSFIKIRRHNLLYVNDRLLIK